MDVGALVLMAAVVVAGWYAMRDRDPNRGWGTTCRDYLNMSHAQRAAVMRKANVPSPNIEQVVAQYDANCGQARDHHPEDMGDPLDYFGP